MTFELKITDWLFANYEPDEVRETSGELSITLDTLEATHAEDELSKSIRDKVFVSAYPLALWFASSWWRLRWEPANRELPIAWRMAHEMVAAGHGFLWPRLTFASDGERVDVICRQSEKTPTEPIRYLVPFIRSIPASEFEQAVDSFITFVLARLDAVGIRNTDLHKIWDEVHSERKEIEATDYRRLEARLGYDPDEAPTEIVNHLLNLSSEVGHGAIAEIAPACSGDDPGATLARVIELAHSNGIEGKVQPHNDLSHQLRASSFRRSMPWEQGRQLAQFARSVWGLQNDQVSNQTLSQILGLELQVFQSTARTQQPLGLAVRNGDSDRLKFLFRRSNRHGRRFEVARFLADHLIAPVTDRWLPATDTGTARQKVQRAFAAEFLCPIVKLQAYLDGDFSDEAVDEASEYFDVSSRTITSHLVNNGVDLGSWQRTELLDRFAL